MLAASRLGAGGMWRRPSVFIDDDLRTLRNAPTISFSLSVNANFVPVRSFGYTGETSLYATQTTTIFLWESSDF